MEPIPNLLCIGCYLPCIFRCNILHKVNVPTTKSLDLAGRCCAAELVKGDVFIKPPLLMEPLISEQPRYSPTWDHYGLPRWEDRSHDRDHYGDEYNSDQGYAYNYAYNSDTDQYKSDLYRGC